MPTQPGYLTKYNIGRFHPGAAAVLAAREAVAEFTLPSRIQLTYRGMHRAAGSGPHIMTEGVVWVEGVFNSMSGHKHSIDIPVMVHDGKMYEPEIFRHSGAIKILSQSAFDDIVQGTEIYNRAPERAHMYAAPGSASAGAPKNNREPQPYQNKGLFYCASAAAGAALDGAGDGDAELGAQAPADLPRELTERYEQEWMNPDVRPEKVLREVEFAMDYYGQNPALREIRNHLLERIQRARK